MTNTAKSQPGWRPTDQELESLKTHDMPTIPVKELPLDDIAEFCRRWGIKEMYSVPMELEFFEPGGPFDGTEVSMRVIYKDDSPAGMERLILGGLLGDILGKKAHVSALFLPDARGFGWREELIMKRKVPVYVE